MEELEVVGHRKEKNDLEDFWMARVEILEKQYDEHINKLEKKLFENKLCLPVASAAIAEKKKLAQQLSSTTKKYKHLSTDVTNLKSQLEQNVKQKYEMEDKILKKLAENVELSRTVKGQQIAIQKFEGATRSLDRQLEKMELEKKVLAHDVKVKDSELKQWKWRKASQTILHQAKLFPAIAGSKASSEPSKELLSVQRRMRQLIQKSRTQEEKLMEMRSSLANVSKQMADGNVQLDNMGREKLRLRTQLASTTEDLTHALDKLKLEKGRTEQWREEVHFRDARLKSEVARNDASALRGRVATLTAELKILQRDRERFLLDQSKLKLKLHGLESLQKSMEQLIRDNVRTRNQILKRLQEQEEILSNVKKYSRSKQSDHNPTYDKQINRLESRIREIEGQLVSTRRRENALRWTLQKQNTTLINQMHWSEKARYKVEAQNRDVEKQCGVWARQISEKITRHHSMIPDKAVNDKERILQKRLLAQASKLENLRAQLRTKSEKYDWHTKQLEDTENWKLLNFLKSYADAKPKDSTNALVSSGSPGQQKEYIETLNGNIARLGQEIAVIERKQFYMMEMAEQLQKPSDDEQDLEIQSFDTSIKFGKGSSTPSTQGEEEEGESSVIPSRSPSKADSNKSSSHSDKESQ